MSKFRNLLDGEAIRAHSGEEIAVAIGATKQYVSQTLRSAMGKYYKGVKRMHPEYTPFEICKEMMEMFDVDDNDLSNFFNLFPTEHKNKIKESAAKKLPDMRKQKVSNQPTSGIVFPKLPGDKLKALQFLYYMFTKYDEEDIPEIPKEYIKFLTMMNIPAGDLDEIAGKIKKQIDVLSK